MKHLVFQNPGVIDPTSISTFGVNVKPNSSNPIGFFGTGLKYALAILARLECPVVIWSGGKRFDFATSKTKVRGKDFVAITMNRKKLPFTTELGKTWDPWMAMRELYCNMQDEGGEVIEIDAEPGSWAPVDSSASTYVLVSGGPILDAWAKRHEVFWDKPGIPELSSAEIEVSQGPSKFIFYRGVRVYELAQPAQYVYNLLTKQDLTEDRTLKYGWCMDRTIVQHWASSAKDTKAIEAFATAPEDRWEGRLDLSTSYDRSPEFEAVAVRLMQDFDPKLNKSLWKIVQGSMLARLTEGRRPLDLDRIDTERVQRAVAFLGKLGYNIDYPIKVVEFLGEGVMGRAFAETIYLSRLAFSMGTKQLTGTILEEWIHLKHKLDDESRGLQNFLLDGLISAGERATGELL